MPEHPASHDPTPAASGNRWEPTDRPDAADPAAERGVDPAEAAPPRRRLGRRELRTAGLAAGAATAVLAVATTGFAVGRVTAPDGPGGPVQLQRGQVPGQLPGQGQPPGRPGDRGGFRDGPGDGDTDGDAFGAAPGA